MSINDIKIIDPDPSDETDAYWVIVVDDNLPPPPELRRFSDFASMTEFIKQVHKKQKTAWILPLHGKILRITEGLGGSTLRFIVDHSGLRVPLFDVPEELALSEQSFYTPAGPDYIDPNTRAFDTTKGNADTPQFGGGLKFMGKFDDDDDDDADDPSDLEF